MVNKTAYLVATQHFDILWRRPLEYYRRTQANVINEVLRIIDEYADFRFSFHQANVMRHFVTNHPQKAELLRRRVVEGAVEIVGGMETVSDTNMVSGESLARNFIYGRQWVRDYFGSVSDTASLLDCFGSSGQLPQIIAGTGHNSLLSGRMPGANFENSPSAHPFTWTGVDGTTINCLFPFATSVSDECIGAWYGWGVLEGLDEEYARWTPDGDGFKANLHQGIQSTLDAAEGRDVVMALICGEEHLPRIETVEAVLEYTTSNGHTLRLGTFADFLEAVDWNNVDRLEGEFNTEFSGCYTTRIRIKQWNQEVETKLYNAEYLHAMEALSGKSKCNPELLKRAWRKLFEGQFHDAICGCHCDDNYLYITQVYEEVKNAADAQLAESAQKRGCLLGSDSARGKTRILNTLPHARRDIARINVGTRSVKDVPCQSDGGEIVFLADIPPGGASDYEITSQGISNVEELDRFPQEGLDVGRYRLIDNGQGFEIFDSQLKRSLFAPGESLVRLVLRQDIGTLWTEDYTGKTADESAGNSKLESINVGPVFTKIVYSGQVRRENVVWPEFESLSWQKTFFVYNHLDRIDLHVDLSYNGKATEICAVFPTSLNASEARARYDIPFGSIEREAYEHDRYKYGRGNWPALSWCDYCDEDSGIAFAHTGTPGCRAAEGKVSFSLLRSATAFKNPLFPTPPEPLSFDNGDHHFEFGLIPHEAGDIDWLQRAREFLNRPLVYFVEENADMLSSSLGSLRIDAPNIVLSSLKAAEDGFGIILRAYEILGRECSASITSDSTELRAVETSLDEERDGGPVDLSCVHFRPLEIKTLRISLAD